MKMGTCSICSIYTELACSDCQIDLRTTVYVCSKPSCRTEHDKKCPHVLMLKLEAQRAKSEMLPKKQNSLEQEPISTILLTCVQKQQFLDDCHSPDCGHTHTRQPVWEVVLQKLDKDPYKNQLIFTVFLENDALPYQVGREYTLTVRERV